jgi:hypothetical protein
VSINFALCAYLRRFEVSKKMYPILAIVSWRQDAGDGRAWVGEIRAVAGGVDVPHKRMYIDGARQGRAKGVEPEQGAPFLTEIVHETKPGERGGVFFAVPLRAVQFGWMPTEDVVSFGGETATRHCWGVQEEGFPPNACYASEPHEGHLENVRFSALSERKRAFDASPLWALVREHGAPDVVEVEGVRGTDYVRMTWTVLGTCTGEVVHGKHLRAFEVPEEIASRFDVEYVGGVDANIVPNRQVTARFRYAGYPSVTFTTEVVGLTPSRTVFPREPFWSALPADERERVGAVYLPLVPDPTEDAESALREIRTTLTRLALQWARLQEPGDMWECGYSGRKTVHYAESPDERRPAGSYKTDAWYSRVRFSLPGMDDEQGEWSREGSYSTEELLADARADVVRKWRRAYRDARAVLKHAGVNSLLRYFGTPEAGAAWLAAHAEALQAEWGLIKEDVTDVRLSTAYDRWCAWLAIEAARRAWGEAHTEMVCLVEVARKSRLWGIFEEDPLLSVPRDYVSRDGSDDLFVEVDWLCGRADQLEEEIRRRAAEKGVRVVFPHERGAVAMGGVPAPWRLYGTDAEAVSCGLGVPGGIGIGREEAGTYRYVPGADPVVVLVLEGGNRVSPSITMVRGVEEVRAPVSAPRHGAVFAYRVVDTEEWRVEWHGVGGMWHADRDGVHEHRSRRVTAWDGTEAEDAALVAEAAEEAVALAHTLSGVACPLCGATHAQVSAEDAKRMLEWGDLSPVCRCHQYPEETLRGAMAEAERQGVERDGLVVYRLLVGGAVAIEWRLRRHLGEWRVVGGIADKSVLCGGGAVGMERVCDGQKGSNDRPVSNPKPVAKTTASVAEGAACPSDDQLAALLVNGLGGAGAKGNRRR